MFEGGPGSKRRREKMAEFSGKVVIVAGGALGIGRTAARRLAARGASVVICSDREVQVERTVEERGRT
jgi:NAD(P)-dependent dehydrogenase (short-subunit alcohol dehydrogenase family)